MTRLTVVLLVIAVAILAVRDRQHERKLAELAADQQRLHAPSAPVSATDTVAKTLKGATLSQLLVDPLKRHVPLETERVIPIESTVFVCSGDRGELLVCEPPTVSRAKRATESTPARGRSAR